MERYRPGNDLGDFLERRLHGVKLAASLLLKELSTSSHDSVILTRRAAESIFATIDIFIDDAEQALQRAGRSRTGGAYREASSRYEPVRKVELPSEPIRQVEPLR